MIKYLLILCGTICVIIGVVGMFVPLLPTTPFLLLAAACYSRSSQRFHNWLLTNRWCGAYIRNYREQRGVLLHHKIMALTLLWITIGYTSVFIVPVFWVKLLLPAIACAVTVHLLKLKTLRGNRRPKSLPSSGNVPQYDRLG